MDFLGVLENQPPIIIPIPSMYGIFTYILPYFTVKKQPNVGKYTGHMDSSGLWVSGVVSGDLNSSYQDVVHQQ